MHLIWLCLATFVAIISAGTLRDGSVKYPEIKNEPLRYDNYTVHKLKIQNRAQLVVLKLFEKLSDKYNIWKDYDAATKEVHIMLSPSENKNFNKLLRLYNVKSELMIENVQQLIDAEQIAPRDTGSFGWTRYYNLEEIEAWLDEILEKYATVATGFEIGKSYEGRTIRGIKISYKSGNPGVFIESNIHAREWITSASATWFINELLSSQKPEVRNLAENYDWYIIPVFNVDGFTYSHNTDRMWRKTRQPHSSSDCIGADPNRNFDNNWMVTGASSSPCAGTFAGTAPFSEVETKHLADYVRSIKQKINIYLAFHSYGQWFMSPYGHSETEKPPNYDDLQQVGAAFTGAVKSLPYGTQYVHGTSGSVLYVTSGSSADYVFNELDIKLVYTIEFRDKGRWGFILPPVQIIPNCEELMAGMVALVNEAHELNYV